MYCAVDKHYEPEAVHPSHLDLRKMEKCQFEHQNKYLILFQITCIFAAVHVASAKLWSNDTMRHKPLHLYIGLGYYHFNFEMEIMRFIETLYVFWHVSKSILFKWTFSKSTLPTEFSTTNGNVNKQEGILWICETN